IGAEVGVCFDEGLFDRLGRDALGLARRSEHRGDVELIAHRADRRKIVPSTEAGTGPVLAVLVAGETVRWIEAPCGSEFAGRRVLVEIAVFGVSAQAIVGPEAMNNEAVARTHGALLGGLVRAAKITEARRPGQGHHVEIEWRLRHWRGALSKSRACEGDKRQRPRHCPQRMTHGHRSTPSGAPPDQKRARSPYSPSHLYWPIHRS